MAKLILILAAAVLSGQVLAVSVREVKYDAQTDQLVVLVKYTGGCEQHNFKLRMFNCSQSDELGAGDYNDCHAQVEDVTESDRCNIQVHQRVLFSLASVSYESRPLVVVFPENEKQSESVVLVTNSRF